MGCASSGPHSGLLGTAEHAVGDTVKAGENFVSEFGEHAKDKIHDGIEHIKETMGGAASTVEHGLSSAMETVGETLGIHHHDKIEETLPTDRLSETETAVASEAEDMMDQVLKETDNIIDESKTELTKNVEHATDMTMTEIENAKNKMDDIVTEKIDKIDEIKTDTVDKIHENVTVLTNGIDDEMENMNEKIGNTIIKLGDEPDQTIQLIKYENVEIEKQDEKMPAMESTMTKDTNDEKEEKDEKNEKDMNEKQDETKETHKNVEEHTSPPTFWERAHDAIVMRPPRPSTDLPNDFLEILNHKSDNS